MFKAVLKKSRDGGKNKKDAGMKIDYDIFLDFPAVMDKSRNFTVVIFSSEHNLS